MGRKRGNGEGSWGTKNIKGVKYFYFRDVNGKYTYDKTRKGVEEKIKNNTSIPIKHITFGKYIKEWLQMKKGIIEDSTFFAYDEAINNMILEFKEYDLKNETLRNLSPKVFQTYLNSLAKHYSRGSILKIWQLIKQCVKYGETQKEIKPNTLVGVKAPLESNVANKKKDIPFIAEDKLNALYELLEGYRDKNNVARFKNSNSAHIIILIAYTGMRVGEATALKWKNVDLDNNTIKIVESTGRIKENGKVIEIDKTTKTKSSIREIPLPKRAIEMIEYFDTVNPEHAEDDLVCVSSSNTRLSRRNINRTLSKMCTLVDIPKLSIHSLRHSYGSILLDKGVDIKTISNLLGHSKISTTYDIYIGVNEARKKEAVDKLNN